MKQYIAINDKTPKINIENELWAYMIISWLEDFIFFCEYLLNDYFVTFQKVLKIF